MNHERRKVLITVKTYPLPSKAYQELVCTAGVLENGSFIRLYPIDYRYMPYWQWYKKYQWIEVEAAKNPKDNRRESYRPKLNSIRPLGAPLPTKDGWAERRKYVLAQGSSSMEELHELQETENVSLGIIRPKKVSDFIIERTEQDWEPKYKAALGQQHLFGPDKKPLEKIPFKFSYVFTCDDPRCNGHEMMITDWELGELYRNMRDKHGDLDMAGQKVRQKFFDQMCSDSRDAHFFVGTIAQYKTWIVLGVFWPPRKAAR